MPDPDANPQPADLLLRTRMEVLRSNLRRVSQVVEATNDRGVEIRELRHRQDEVEKNLDMLRFFLSRLESAFGVLEGGAAEAGKRDLEEAMKTLEKACESVRQTKPSLDRLHGRLAAPLDGGAYGTLDIKLAQRAGVTVDSIAELVQRLSAPGDVDLSQLWQEVVTLSREKTPILFEEYVDLLRGLALRESGLDQEIGKLADRFVLEVRDARQYGLRWQSLVIPSLRPQVHAGGAQFVRLGFPEWTIWALPIAAHAFGRLLVVEEEKFSSMYRQLVKDHLPEGYDEVGLTDCVADVFALYATGPAYALAAVLMQLDPTHHDRDRPHWDAIRARVIFGAWELADNGADQVAYGTEMRQALQTAWSNALDQAKPADGGKAAPAIDAAVMQPWIETVWRWLEEKQINAYPPARWEAGVDELKRAIEDGEVRRVPDEKQGEKPYAPPRGTDMRDVLNAAWCCRFAVACQAHDQETALHRAQELETDAQTLWKRAARASDKAPTSRREVNVQSDPWISRTVEQQDHGG